ncbi:hypothetical protein AGLY_010703 [Aphis glycines]|uniref:Uncharacterized protein n=1 Tax=Aphis glycines TaxID=307491 RepID=A0A6G0TGI1_APHGL|nr:hypothetical protein AGLY_010703 [Aphis glycines]
MSRAFSPPTYDPMSRSLDSRFSRFSKRLIACSREPGKVNVDMAVRVGNGTENRPDGSRLYSATNTSSHRPSSVNEGGGITGSSARQNFSIRFSTETVRDTGSDAWQSTVVWSTGPIRIHPKMEPNAVGRSAATVTFRPSTICANKSAPNSTSTGEAILNVGSARAKFANRSLTLVSKDRRGILDVIAGSTHAFVFNCGSSANRGWMTQSTVPRTSATAVPDRPLIGAVQFFSRSPNRAEHDTVMALI